MNEPQDQPQGPWAPPASPTAPATPATPATQPGSMGAAPTLPPAAPRPTLPTSEPSSSPFAPGGTFPPGGGPAIDPAAPEVPLDGSGGRRKRSKGALVGAVVGVTALVAAGAFAVVQITGNDESGGAATAEEVGTQLTTALDNEDLLGVIDLLLPGERDTFREPMIDLVDHLRRLEVLSDEADLSKVGGFDIVFTDVTVREESTNVDDISNIYLSGSASVSVDGESVPLGDLLIDELFDGERPDMDADAEPAEFDDTKLTVVERDGRWYLSLFYSAAEAARGDADIPDEGIEPKGGDSPEGALDTFFDAVSDFDVEGALAALDPTEAEALQRYAPLFLREADDAVDDLGIEWGITDTEYEVSGEGSRRTVQVTALTFEASVPDEGEVRAEFSDGCLTVSLEGDEESFCRDDLQADALEEFGIGDEGLQDFLDTVEEAFAEWEPGGIAVHEVDGQWYVSPLRSVFDLFDGMLAALDADELRDIIDAGSEAADSVLDPLDELGDPFSDDPFSDDPFSDEGATDDGMTDDGMTDDGTGDATDGDALSACYAETDAAVAIQCMNDGIAAGTIEASYVPAHFRHPECGAAEAYFDRLFDMTDAEFVALAEAASPCFLALIASGELDSWEVAGELIAPECLEGKNWYTDFDSEYSERFFDCTYEAQLALD